MDKVFQLAIETFLGLLVLTCGVPPEDSVRVSELASTGDGARFACIIQVDNSDTWLAAGKIYKIADTDKLPEFN